jgi:hypothetical protein
MDKLIHLLDFEFLDKLYDNMKDKPEKSDNIYI